MAEINDLVPEASSIVVMKLEGVFQELVTIEIKKKKKLRRSNLILDARGCLDKSVLIKKIDALAEEILEYTYGDGEELWDVEFLGVIVSTSMQAVLAGVCTILLCFGDAGDPIQIYLNDASEALKVMLDRDPTEGLDPNDDPDARPVTEFMTPDEAEQFNKRVRQLRGED